jgi:hypothetical protein
MDPLTQAPAPRAGQPQGIRTNFPRAPLYALAGLVLASLAVWHGRPLTGYGAVTAADAPPVAADPAVRGPPRRQHRGARRARPPRDRHGRARHQAASCAARCAAGARARKRAGIGAELPFELTGRSDGR